MSKVERALHGPSWAEVILGAVLSLVLGVIAGAALLVLKPVVKVTEMPKEPVRGAVYYQEGVGGASSSQSAAAKRKAFVAGQSVGLSEQELNALADQLTAESTPAAKPGEKPAAPAASTEMLAPGTPNARIHDGMLQIGVPVALNVLGFDDRIIVQARGGFAKEGGQFAYEPSELYLGSCPVQRLPFLSSYIRGKLLGAHPVPADVASAWGKLANVSIEGNTLNLTMP